MTENDLSPNAEIIVDYLHGDCPVQGEGKIGRKPFYFRARGSHWSLSIGNDPIMAPEWRHKQWYGEWPSAGWMDIDEAMGFLTFAADRYLQGLPGEIYESAPATAEGQSEPKSLTP